MQFQHFFLFFVQSSIVQDNLECSSEEVTVSSPVVRRNLPAVKKAATAYGSDKNMIS